jgi:serine/threonine-protein kinase
VPNRTLPTAEDALLPRQPTTDQPVADARARTTAGHPKRLRPATLAAIVFGGAAVGVTIVALGLVIAKGRATHTSSAGIPEASAVVSAAAVATSALSVPPAVPAPPEVAATDLPGATPNSAPPPSRPSPTPRPVSAPTPPAPKVDCSPPYTVDSTGHKHWKVQCL